jgi:hypothetical protein
MLHQYQEMAVAVSGISATFPCVTAAAAPRTPTSLADSKRGRPGGPRRLLQWSDPGAFGDAIGVSGREHGAQDAVFTANERANHLEFLRQYYIGMNFFFYRQPGHNRTRRCGICR